MRPRYAWVDVAKGACIALVVLLHATNFMVGREMADPRWSDFNALLQPVRMPLFFLASGLFLAKTLALPWRAVLARRVVPLVYVYVLWTFLRWAYFTLFPATSGTAEAGSIWKPIRAMVIPDSGMWFIFALAVFTVAARALVHVPTVVQLVGTAVLSVASPYLAFDSWTWHNMAGLFVFFLLGAYAAVHAHAVAAVATPVRAATALLVFVCGYTLVRDTVASSSSLAHFGLTLVGLVAGILVAATLARYRFTEPLQQLGRRTLQVFLLHEIAFGTLVAVLTVAGLDLVDAQRIPLGPVVVTAFAVAASLTAHRVAMRCGLRWLFTKPALLPALQAVRAHARSVRVRSVLPDRHAAVLAWPRARRRVPAPRPGQVPPRLP
ncbi:acyltransferase family protein [Rhodococcus sp. HNM0569]|nr:acyltransferase family protein [Rhodococcus sp. HNM0569]